MQVVQTDPDLLQSRDGICDSQLILLNITSKSLDLQVSSMNQYLNLLDIEETLPANILRIRRMQH